MRYGLLGALELNEDGRSIEIAGAKQRALLAMLLLNANRVVSSDALIDALWEERAARHSVEGAAGARFTATQGAR